MKNLYLAFLLLCVVACSDPSENIKPSGSALPKDTESLQAMLDTNIDEATKLQVYWKLYKELRATEPDKALSYLNMQYVVADKVGNATFKGLAYQGKGVIYAKQRKYNEAVDSYFNAITIFDADNDAARTADQFNNVGSVFMWVGGYDYAIDFLEKAAQYFKQSGESNFLMITYSNLGLCHSKKKHPDFSLAESYFSKAITVLQENGRDSKYLSKLYRRVGQLNFDAHNYPVAIANYKKALKFLDGIMGVEEQKVNTYHNIAEAYMYWSGDYYDKAAEWLDKATNDKGHEIKNHLQVARLNIVGEFKQRLGRHKEAISVLEQAIGHADGKKINPPLQKTLALMRASQGALVESGYPVSARKLLGYSKLEAKQRELKDKFEAEVIKEAQNKALLKVIALYQSKQEKALFESRFDRAVKTVGILGLVVLIGIVLYKRKNAQFKKAKQGEVEAMAKKDRIYGMLKKAKEVIDRDIESPNFLT